ncbi:MAG: hypothetical protein INR73_28505, partial [Williamsia sp.]|nr:hypothetical protein [Williamsia sp.]
IEGKAQKVRETQLETHETKMKQISLLSENEIKEAKLETQASSYADKKKYYETLEKLEIDEVNKVKVARKISDDELATMRQAALEKIVVIQEKYHNIQMGLLAIEKKELSENVEKYIDDFQKTNDAAQEYVFGPHGYITQTTTGFKTLAQIAKQRATAEVAAEKDVQKEREQTADMLEKSVAASERATKKIIGYIADFADKASPLLGSVTKGVLTVIENLDVLSGKSLENAKANEAEAKSRVTVLQSIYDAGMGGTAKQLEVAKQASIDATNMTTKQRVDSAAAIFGVMGTIYQVLSAVAGAINQMNKETYQAIAEAMAKTRNAYKELYEFIEKTSREAYEQELANFSGSYEQKIAKINNFYDQEKTMIEGRDRIDAQLSYNQKMAEIGAVFADDAKKGIEELIRYQITKDNDLQQHKINLAEQAIQKAKEVRDTELEFIEQKLQAALDAIQKEMDAVQAASEKEIDLINDKLSQFKDAQQAALDLYKQQQNDALSAFKDRMNAEIDALNDNLSKQKAALEQFSSDKQLRLQYDDQYRADLLRQGEIREVQALEDAKQRELARAASVEERARIENAFNQLIADKHKEYQDAMADKTKQVSLANQEVKAQEADKVQTLEEQTATKVAEIKDAMLAKEKQTQADILAEETKTKDAIAAKEKQTALEIAKIQQDTADHIADLQKQQAYQEGLAAQQKERVNIEYLQSVQRANRDIFEAEKAMKVAELQAEIAVLNSKKNIFNESKVIDAVGKIEASIRDIQGISFYANDIVTTGMDPADFFKSWGISLGVGGSTGGSGQPRDVNSGQVVTSGFDKKGNPMTITYNPSGKVIDYYDAQGNRNQVAYADGYVPATGEHFQKGTESVGGGQYPDGIDTVPAWLTKGERVMTVAQNRLLGGISNEEVVRRAMLWQHLSQLGPMLGPAQVASLLETAPAFGDAGMMGALSELKTALASQKQLIVNMDVRGVHAYLKGDQSVTSYNYNLMNR